MWPNFYMYVNLIPRQRVKNGEKRGKKGEKVQSILKSSSSSWVQPLCLRPVGGVKRVCGHPGVKEEEEEAVGGLVGGGYIAFDLC